MASGNNDRNRTTTMTTMTMESHETTSKKQILHKVQWFFTTPIGRLSPCQTPNKLYEQQQNLELYDFANNSTMKTTMTSMMMKMMNYSGLGTPPAKPYASCSCCTLRM